MSFWKKFKEFLFAAEPADDTGWVEVRNRNEKGHFKADDKDTTDVNEAFVKVKGSAKGKFKDTDKKKPGVQNSAVKKPVKKKTAVKKPKK